jgi:hypothetical protein
MVPGGLFCILNPYWRNVMSKDLNSNELTSAMLRAHLSGNEIKVLLAYVSKGGWKYGTEVFLPESARKEYGLADSTVKRMRKSLVTKGWMVPTGNKSYFGCDMYLIRIPAVVHAEPPTPVTPDLPVVHSDPSGSSDRSTEVTKEVTKELPKLSNEEENQKSNPPEDDSGLTGVDPRFSGLFLNPGSLELPAGGPPGDGAGPKAVAAAREALSMSERPGTIYELDERERRRAVELMLDPGWKRHLRFIQDRAINARDEVMKSREVVW